MITRYVTGLLQRFGREWLFDWVGRSMVKDGQMGAGRNRGHRSMGCRRFSVQGGIRYARAVLVFEKRQIEQVIQLEHGGKGSA